MVRTLLGHISSMLIGAEIVILSVMLNSCVTWHEKSVDDTMKPYKDSFLVDMQMLDEHFKGLDIKFLSLSDSIVGQCNPFTKKITIDPTYFFKANEKQKSALIYHELGHCVCDKVHYDKKLKDGCPKSLMYQNIPWNSCLQTHWNYYIIELRERCKRR